MPELPEVEVMRLSLRPAINTSIDNIHTSNYNLRQPITQQMPQQIIGKQITNITRLGKFLIFHCVKNNEVAYIIFHAGMSGSFMLHYDQYIKQKHDHVVLFLNNNTVISFNDPRRFGLCVSTKQNFYEHKVFQNIGKDALLSPYTAKELQELWKNKKSNIKSALLEQNIITGIGNIYASEILFQSKVHPQSICNKLSTDTVKSILDNTQLVLKKAISLGGSTLNDHKAADGKIGYFQTQFSVYNQHNKSCSRCSSKNINCSIVKYVQNGRSTFFCPNTQKLIS